MNIYLIGPIDHAAKDGQDWKKKLNELLTNSDGDVWTLYDPYTPWMMAGNLIHDRKRAKYVETVNKTALLAADVAVAYLPPNVISIGSPIEIDQAVNARIPVILATGIPYGCNMYLLNRVNKDQYIEFKGRSIDLVLHDMASKLIMHASNMTTKIEKLYKSVEE